MDIRELTKNEALELCSMQEGHSFDRKAYEIQPKKIQKIAVAFANSDGGEIVIGIADDSDEAIPEKRWKGALRIEDYNSHIQALTEVIPTLDMKISFLTCKILTGYVLHIIIEKSSSVHQTSDKTVYQRVSAQSIPLAPQRIIELSYAKGMSSFEDQIIVDALTEDIVDSEELNSFLTEVSPKSDPIEFVLNQNLVDRKTWEPRAAGILLFSKLPSAIMPRKCSVKISRYETREDEPERDHLKEQHTIEGPLYLLIYKTVEKITEIMSNVKIWTIGGLKEVEYPPETIWEVIVNAIIHRDYSISDDIQVLIFNDRIEVTSPGKFPGYVTVNNYLEARYSRNPKIVRTLNRYKTPPNKDMGEGLNTAFQKMKEWRLKDPIITEEGNYVKVVLPHTPLASPEEIILKFLETNEVIKNAQARDITGIRSENVVKTVFYKLRDENYIERVPGLDGSASAWRLKKDA